MKKNPVYEFAGTGSGLHCWQILIFLCLRVKFHKALFWVPILDAGGPYWVPISQRVGSLFQSFGVPISFWNSATGTRSKDREVIVSRIPQCHS